MLTFERIFTTDSVDEIVDTAKECDSFEINEQAIALFRGVDEHREELDGIIAQHLKNWSIGRIKNATALK